MTAVNLIPHDQRSGRFSLSATPATLALFSALAAALVAALLYVSAANKVAARRSELAKVTAGAAAWKTVASALAQYVSVSQQRVQRLAAVRQLAAARFPWPRVLGQFAHLLPSDVALTSLTASTTANGATTTSGGTTASTSPSSSSSSSSPPAFQLSGCAASQSAVAQTMQQLRNLDGGSDVALSSSSAGSSGTGTSVSASSASSTGAGGGCGYPVTFQMSVTITGGSNAAGATSSPATTTTSSPSPTATGSSTTTTAAAQ